MSGAVIWLLVFAFLAGAGLLVLWLHPHLPAAYRTKETTDLVRLGVGVISTISAVALGLLISSVKGSFDQVNHDVQAFATELIILDRALRLHGTPEAEEARALLTRYTERAIQETWLGSGGAVVVDDRVAGALLDHAEAATVALPPDPRRPGLTDRIATDIRDVVRRRWALLDESGSAVSPPLVAILVLWLGLTFASFGYNTPRNGLVVAVLLVSAASVAGALFMIIEMDGAFTWLIAVPDAPMRRALAHMQAR
jgi:hypothetical protein